MVCVPDYYSSPVLAKVQCDFWPALSRQNITRVKYPTAAGPQHAGLANHRVMRKGNKRPTAVFIPQEKINLS